MIVACYHPLPLSACMLHLDLVSILFAYIRSLTALGEGMKILYIKDHVHSSIVRAITNASYTLGRLN